MNKEKLIAAIAEIYDTQKMNCVVIYDSVNNLKYVISEGMYPKEIQIDIDKYEPK